METSINWKYFFGGSGGNTFDRYYYDIINGVRVERHASNRRVRYSIGNMDHAKVKYSTEKELIEALNQTSKTNTNE